MNATTKTIHTASSAVMLAIDLAKDVFELAFADAAGRIVERKRLKRTPFSQCLQSRAPLRIVMEACGSALRHALAGMLDRIVACQTAMDAIEKQLADIAKRDTRSQRLMAASGVGLITATAMSAGIGDFARFPSGRHFASALGLTPREYSSGGSRTLGRITKRGDVYLRTLLIHGARSALVAAHIARKRGQPLDRTQQWALALAERKGHNKAAVALANKTARRLWAAEHHGTSFDPEHVSRRAEQGG